MTHCLIVNEVSISPQSSSTDYSLGLQIQVSFLTEENQQAERTWFINRTGSLIGSSTNILGNRDGEVLDDPQSFKTKEDSKLSVLDTILQPNLYPDLYSDYTHICYLFVRLLS